MTDIEKAIYLLQQCLDERPYAAVRVSQIMSCIQEAVGLLKEQEPVKPAPGMLCGECGCRIYQDANYCYNCGRLVKWDE